MTNDKKSKITWKILIFSVSIIIASLIGFLLFFYLTLNYDEQVTERITNNVFVINDPLVSMYLVKTDSGYIAIDTGFFHSFVTKGLAYNKISVDEIKIILLTHSDADHINNIDLFNKAKVFLSEAEYKTIVNNEERFNFFHFCSNKYNTKNFMTLDEGDSLSFGGVTIFPIALPGHTAGLMGYIIANKYLFTGDAFRLKNGKITAPYRKMFVNNLDMMEETIRKVSNLKKIEYIFTAHSGFTADFNFAVSK